MSKNKTSYKNCLARDLRGKRFTRLIALEPTNERRSGSIVWKCKCDCGNICRVASSNLILSRTRSCGCLHGDIASLTHFKHGQAKVKKRTLVYITWQQMIQRCYNPNNPKYKDYGERGIKVCEQWHTFENFYADVGDRPKGKSIDRWPDNNGNYEPTNWRWATQHEQRVNSRPASCGPAKQFWFFGYRGFGEIFISNNQSEVARTWGLESKNISACLCGKERTHHGWTFKRILNYEITR